MGPIFLSMFEILVGPKMVLIKLLFMPLKKPQNKIFKLGHRQFCRWVALYLLLFVCVFIVPGLCGMLGKFSTSELYI